MKRAIIRWLICLPLACGAAGASAQLTDPTRPPGALAGGDPGAPGGGTQLQSVMISPSGRSAIIGGETVKLNGKYGDARVIRITETEVVLRSAGGTEILHMYPDISMKPVAALPPAGVKPAAKKRRPATNTQGKQE